MYLLMWIIFLLAGTLIVYHHVLYPLILKLCSQRMPQNEQVSFNKRYYQRCEEDAILPTISIVVPAHNEKRHIIDKLNNLQCLDYPRDRLHVLLLCDGCEDGTDKLATQWAASHKEEDFNLNIVAFTANQGKVAMINYAQQHIQDELIVFSDATALLSIDALLIAASHFADPKVGVVAATYRLLSHGHYAEALYWQYQTHIKRGEAQLGAPIGVHGAGYVVRTSCTERLVADTINDDLILPMQIVAKGFRAIYDSRIIAVELETTPVRTDLERRKRISAGNWQQIVKLKALMHPRFGGTCFNFISGKVLRVFMPFALLFFFISSLGLSFYHVSLVGIVIVQVVFYVIALLAQWLWQNAQPNWMAVIHYFVYSHMITLVGLYRYLSGYYSEPWQRVSTYQTRQRERFTHWLVFLGKWLIDKVAAVVGCVVLVIITPVVALLIKLDSPGPIFLRQLRVGRQWPDFTELFHIIKFRTMVVDAEREGNARWAETNDPRITRVGKFLRKTRLDELPQVINILEGKMSLLGPRPERPGFYSKLERAIPFYSERIFGVTPGISGLAQVLVGYDKSVADVRRKVAFDHAYALALTKPWPWLKMECYIAILTVKIIIFGRGH